MKCGKKDVYQESLCEECYNNVYPPRVKKKKIRDAKQQVKHPEYYEAILQLRNVGNDIINFVREKIEASAVFVSKEIPSKNGVDLYLSSKLFAKKLCSLLQRKYGGMVKTSAKLFSVSRQTSKKIYRLTYLFKRPKFDLGDFIDFRGKHMKVREIKKYVLAVDENGKRHRLRFDALEKARLL